MIGHRCGHRSSLPESSGRNSAVLLNMLSFRVYVVLFELYTNPQSQARYERLNPHTIILACVLLGIMNITNTVIDRLKFEKTLNMSITNDMHHMNLVSNTFITIAYCLLIAELIVLA